MSQPGLKNTQPRIGITIAAALLPLGTVTAQGSVLRGTVVDDHGRGLPHATVGIEVDDRSVLTDEQGRFTLRVTNEGPHTVLARQIGFAPLRWELRTGTGGVAVDTLRMSRIALVLDPVRVMSRTECTVGGFDTTNDEDVALLFDQARLNGPPPRRRRRRRGPGPAVRRPRRPPRACRGRPTGHRARAGSRRPACRASPSPASTPWCRRAAASPAWWRRRASAASSRRGPRARRPRPPAPPCAPRRRRTRACRRTPRPAASRRGWRSLPVRRRR